MQAFYKTEEPNKYYDEEGKFKWDAQSSSSESEESESEREEQQDDESEVNLDELVNADVKVVEEVDIGKRLALTNMDWDNINATDLLALFTSLCKGEMIITKVEIMPSLYGIEQMKKDTLYGPPKELFDEEAKPAKKNKKAIAEDVDDEGDVNAFD